MAVGKIVIFLVSTVLVLSESYYVTPFSKCNSKDSQCLKSYFQSVILEAAKNGYQQIGIPILDPVQVKNYVVSVPGWLDLELIEGVGQGMRSCIVEKFSLDLEKRHGSVEVVCDASIHGHYKAYSNSSLIRNLLNGDLICGEGNGAIQLEKVKLSYDFRFVVEKRGGDYFLNADFDNSKVDVDILEGVNFAGDNLFLGQVEASNLIISVMNQYWKMILNATGAPVLDKFFKLIFDYTQNYLYYVPVRHYLYDDVSPYVISSFRKGSPCS